MPVQREKKWDYTEDSDHERKTVTRTIIGRMTRARYELLRAYCRKHTNNAPYGRSEGGYPYSCGCAGDCCGHLIGEGMWMRMQHWMGGYKITLFFSQSFNY